MDVVLGAQLLFQWFVAEFPLCWPRQFELFS